MIRKLAFHEISQKLPFQGNKAKRSQLIISRLRFCFMPETEIIGGEPDLLGLPQKPVEMLKNESM